VVLALRRTDFVPRPAVNSVVVHLRRRARPVLFGADAGWLQARVRRAFAGPESAHARELSFDEWVASFRAGVPRGRSTVLRGSRRAAGSSAGPPIAFSPVLSPGSRRPSLRAPRRE
jgi:hypothetical protein